MKVFSKQTYISKQCILSLLTIFLAGCSSVTHSTLAQKAGLFPDRENAYVGSTNLPPLKTPPSVPAIENDPYFAIPDASASQKKPVSLLPPGSLAAKQAGKSTVTVTSPSLAPAQ